jgi:(1->4)-alpha-D-glucan 1-alpha-D-glucosylmutase
MKLYATMVSLDYRRTHPVLFQQGEYLPLESGGSKKQHICAFARVHEDQAVITVVPRLLATFTQDVKNPPIGDMWEDSWIAVPPWPTLRAYRQVLTGDTLATESVNGRRVVPLSRVFRHCPLGLLERQPE